MIDYLVKIVSRAAAKAALASWVKNGSFQLPQYCDLLPVDAYTALATYDEHGTQLTPPTLASGQWFIVSLDHAVTLPTAGQAAIQAQADRADGLTLPTGIVGLSTLWAGMRLN